MESNETNMDYPISSRISSFLHFKEEKNAEEIVKKTASDELLLTRIIEEYKEGWHTFSEDDDAIWFFSRVLNVTSNERIKQLSRKNLIIALNRKAIRSIDKGHLDDAEKVLTESFQKGLEDEHTHLFYSVLLRKIGLTKEADDELRRSMDLNPDIYYNTYALLLHRAGLVEEAERFFDKAFKNPKNLLDTYISYLIYLKETDQFKLILEYGKKIIEMDPEDPRTYHDYAFALANLGRYREAIDYLWKCIDHADALDDTITVMYSDLLRITKMQGRENYKRVIAREICNLVTFQMNSTSTEDIEKVKSYFPKNRYWTMFYNGCICYIKARNYWYDRQWDLANDAFYRADIRFDMSDELGALGHTLIVWNLFCVDRDLNDLFSQIDFLDRETILKRIEKLPKAIGKTPREDKFGQMINGYVESLEYLNNLLWFFRKTEKVEVNLRLIPRIRKVFAENDFAAGFDMLDILRKIEMCIGRKLRILTDVTMNRKEEAEFHIRCWEEIKNYLCSAIIALNGPSIYEMVRNGDKQVALSELLKEKAFLLETSPVLGTSTEIELIEEWRKFRDAVVNKRETKRKYRSLVKNAVGLWKECNELARQKNWSGTGVIFRPTTRAVGIPIKLYELALKNRNELADFLRDIYMWIIESSLNGERFPENTEIAHYLQIIKNLRHHFEHDREHGEVSKVKRKYVQVGRIFEELIGKQPLNEKDWYLLQIAVLLRVKGILTLTLEEVSKYRT